MREFQEYQYKIVSNLDEKEIIKWIELENDINPIVFQRFFFIKSWLKNIYTQKKYKLFFIFIYKSKKLMCVLPLCIKKSFLFNSLEWLGEPFNDLNFPIFKEEILNKFDFHKFLNVLLDDYKDDITIIRLKKQIKLFNNNINPLFHSSSFISKEKRKILLINSSNNSRSHNIENFLNNQNSKLFRRIKKNIAKYNLVHKSYQNNDSNYKERIYNFVLKNKASKMDRTGVWNYLNFPKYKNFIKDILNSNYSYCSELYDNKELINCQIGFKIKNHYYHMFPAYNENYKKISPGHLGIYYVLKELFHEKDKLTFDFTIGNETYKDYWSNREEYLFTNYYYRNFYGKLIINLINYLDSGRNSFIFKILKQIYIKIKK